MVFKMSQRKPFLNFRHIYIQLVFKREKIHSVAVFSGYDMEMQMENARLCRLSAGVDYIHAVVTAVLYVVFRYPLHGRHSRREVFIVAVEHVRAMFFRDNESVSRRVARDIEKRVSLFVLLDLA